MAFGTCILRNMSRSLDVKSVQLSKRCGPAAAPTFAEIRGSFLGACNFLLCVPGKKS